jgi:Kelch motif
MPSFNPWKKRRSARAPSTSAPGSGLASSQGSQQLQFPTNSQSHLQSPQEKQQSQPVGPWSAHIPPSGQWPSPFPRHSHAISTTATAAGELFLFGGFSDGHYRGDLYVISTRDLSTTLLKTSGDVPSPRYAHCAVLTSTILLIWGGASYQNVQNSDDSFYLLNLGTSDLFHVKTCSS